MAKNLHSIIAKALKDKKFKQKLLENPKGVIEQELEIHFGENVKVQILEESENKRYLVLPAHSEEMSAKELEMIAAGQSIPWTELRQPGRPPISPVHPGENPVYTPPGGH